MRPLYKHKLKKSLALLLYGSGIAEHLLRQRTANRCIVLMYHRVMPEPDRQASLSHSSITLCTETFEKQMAYVASRFTPLSADELREHLRTQKAFPTNSILITFDDGWKDNYTHAMPALKANKIPALIFLSTGFIGTKKRFWQERMTSLLLSAAGQAQSNPGIAEKLQAVFSRISILPMLATYDKDRRCNVENLVQSVKGYDYSELSDIILQLEKIQKTNPSDDVVGRNYDREFLSWDEIREMHRAGMDFGSHGVNHLILDKNSVDINFELKQSQIDIKTMLGVPVTAFSFPNGNYNQNVVEMLQSHGYGLGFSTEFGYNDPRANPFLLNRINIHQDATSTIPLFIGRILGFW